MSPQARAPEARNYPYADDMGDLDDIPPFESFARRWPGRGERWRRFAAQVATATIGCLVYALGVGAAFGAIWLLTP